VQLNDATTCPYHLTILKEQYLHNNTNTPFEISHGLLLDVDLFDQQTFIFVSIMQSKCNVDMQPPLDCNPTI
jgi:hypothetical protein